MTITNKSFYWKKYGCVRIGQSITPKLFWYLSLVGSIMLLTYAVAVKDPVIILGQAFGVIIYCRNLILIRNAAVSQKTTAIL